ncbi:nuclear envelope integral membrane protein [Epargyreus clarus]|uniref:nuclear envelope integral membrane protein n=1 Tax=Epargyreus clarus TaxID=520877 RepID=UPI003C2F6C3E
MECFGSRSSLFLLLFFGVFVGANSLAYDVHWLGGPTSIDRDIPSAKQTIDIYCYSGTDKNLLSLWQTVKFHIKQKTDEFSQYIGENPEDVYNQYTEDSYGWAVVSPFQRKSYKTVSIDLFTPTCMAVNTKQKHSIELQIQRVDLWRVLCMAAGIVLIFSSRALSGNPLFFYLCGITVGVSASFMVIVYYVSKLLPRKTLTYGLLIGGWTVGVYVFQRVWENVRTIALSYQAYTFWYVVVAALASFAVCYRVGPPRDRRSKNLVMWTLQVVGVLLIFFSSQYQEASAAVSIIALIAKYFPKSLWYRIQGYWRRRFPPATRLLTSEQYYEQGARETQRALAELRRHCASPDCAQWRVMLRLSDAKRFASFVEGDSHLSDDEVLDYESYAFSTNSSATKPERVDISDDDDDSDDSDQS